MGEGKSNRKEGKVEKLGIDQTTINSSQKVKRDIIFNKWPFLIFSSSEGIPKGRGTVGDMSPSLLTALRRKQLLIVAGDVETNPGPGMNLIIYKVCTSSYMYIYSRCVYS